MKEPAPLPFLARPGYRLRRFIEAIKLMPFLGLLMFLLPLLWATGAQETPALTSNGWLYVFAVWFGLIGLAVLGARIFDRADQDIEDQDDGL